MRKLLRDPHLWLCLLLPAAMGGLLQRLHVSAWPTVVVLAYLASNFLACAWEAATGQR